MSNISYGRKRDGKSVWNFHQNNIVTNAEGVSGRWQKKDTRIIIRWQGANEAWDTLDFPLTQKTVSGDSWAGVDWISATKQDFKRITTRNDSKNYRIETLLGKWKISHGDEWTFHRDGSVANKHGWSGRRTQKDSRIIIRWNVMDAWDTMDFPLNQKIVSGDSWDGPDDHTATKASNGVSVPSAVGPKRNKQK